MHIKPIKTEADYEETLLEINKCFDAKPNTPRGDKLEVLVTLVESYEEEHHQIELPDPIDQIQYVMETRKLKRKDLQPYIGTRARVSEILNRKRELTLPMIRKLHKYLHIPARILIR